MVAAAQDPVKKMSGIDRLIGLAASMHVCEPPSLCLVMIELSLKTAGNTVVRVRGRHFSLLQCNEEIGEAFPHDGFCGVE